MERQKKCQNSTCGAKKSRCGKDGSNKGCMNATCSKRAGKTAANTVGNTAGNTAGNSTQILYVEPNFSETPSDMDVFYDCFSDVDVQNIPKKQTSILPAKKCSKITSSVNSKITTSVNSKITSSANSMPTTKQFRETLKQVVNTAQMLLVDFDNAVRRERKNNGHDSGVPQTRTIQLEVTARVASNTNGPQPSIRIEPVTFTIPLKLHMQGPGMMLGSQGTMPTSRDVFSSVMRSRQFPQKASGDARMEPIRTAIITAPRQDFGVLPSHFAGKLEIPYGHAESAGDYSKTAHVKKKSSRKHTSCKICSRARVSRSSPSLTSKPSSVKSIEEPSTATVEQYTMEEIRSKASAMPKDVYSRGGLPVSQSTRGRKMCPTCGQERPADSSHLSKPKQKDIIESHEVGQVDAEITGPRRISRSTQISNVDQVCGTGPPFGASPPMAKPADTCSIPKQTEKAAEDQRCRVCGNVSVPTGPCGICGTLPKPEEKAVPCGICADMPGGAPCEACRAQKQPEPCGKNLSIGAPSGICDIGKKPIEKLPCGAGDTVPGEALHDICAVKKQPSEKLPCGEQPPQKKPGAITPSVGPCGICGIEKQKPVVEQPPEKSICGAVAEAPAVGPCGICGKKSEPIVEQPPEKPVCGAVAETPAVGPCGICGKKPEPIVEQQTEKPICGTVAETPAVGPCGICGKKPEPIVEQQPEKPICGTVAETPAVGPCGICGKKPEPIVEQQPENPICGTVAEAPAVGPCGICGMKKPEPIIEQPPEKPICGTVAEAPAVGPCGICGMKKPEPIVEQPPKGAPCTHGANTPATGPCGICGPKEQEVYAQHPPCGICPADEPCALCEKKAQAPVKEPSGACPHTTSKVPCDICTFEQKSIMNEPCGVCASTSAEGICGVCPKKEEKKPCPTCSICGGIKPPPPPVKLPCGEGMTRKVTCADTHPPPAIVGKTACNICGKSLRPPPLPCGVTKVVKQKKPCGVCVEQPSVKSPCAICGNAPKTPCDICKRGAAPESPKLKTPCGVCVKEPPPPEKVSPCGVCGRPQPTSTCTNCRPWKIEDMHKPRYYMARPQHRDLQICSPCRYHPSPLIDEEGRVFCPHNCGCCLCPWRLRTPSQDDQIKHQKLKVCKCRTRATLFDANPTEIQKCSQTSYFDVCPCRERAEAKYLEMFGTEMWNTNGQLQDTVRGDVVSLDDVVEVRPRKSVDQEKK